MTKPHTQHTVRADQRTDSKLEWLGRLVAVWAGSLCSPMWPLLNWVMKPYIEPYSSLNSFLTSSNMLISYINLIARLKQAGAAALFFNLIPELLLCGLVSLIYVLFCGYVGSVITRTLIKALSSGSHAQTATHTSASL